MSTSIACSLPSAALLDAAPTKSPALMSETLFLTMPTTVKLGASAIVSTGPSRDFTVSVWPSSLSTVPRIRVGVPAGGAWARAGPTARAIRAAAIASLLIVQSPCSRCYEESCKSSRPVEEALTASDLHWRLDAVLLRRHSGRRPAAVGFFEREDDHRGARPQQARVARNIGHDRRVRLDDRLDSAVLVLALEQLALRRRGDFDDERVGHQPTLDEARRPLAFLHRRLHRLGEDVHLYRVQLAVRALDRIGRDIIAGLDVGEAALGDAASAIVTGGPSFGFTVKLWPSSFSTVPRTTVGVPSGGA